MSAGKVIIGPLHRVQRGHGRAFAADPPAERSSVRRPARVAIMLALAHKIARAIAEGRLRDQADAARQLGVTRPRVTQLLALLQIAPDVQERVLFLEAIDGREPLTERDLRPVVQTGDWTEQRARLRGGYPAGSPRARRFAMIT